MRLRELLKESKFVKTHVILKGMALCNTDCREGGYQAVGSRQDFEKQPKEEQCKKCAATLNKMGGKR